MAKSLVTVSLLILLLLAPTLVQSAINFPWYNLRVFGQTNANSKATTQLNSPSTVSINSTDSSIWVANTNAGTFVQYDTNIPNNFSLSIANLLDLSGVTADSARTVPTNPNALLASTSGSLYLYPNATTSSTFTYFRNLTNFGLITSIDTYQTFTYLASFTQNRIIVLDGNYNFIRAIGQPDINSTGANQPSGSASNSNLNSPFGIKTDCNGGLWVCDSRNNRLLHFPAGSGTADVVIGQAGPTTNSRGYSNRDITGPLAVELSQDCQTLWVSDVAGRVLRFSAPYSNYQNATAVLGQNSFTSDNQGLGPEKFGLIQGIDYDDSTGYLYLADTNNNRIIGGRTTTNGSFVGVNGTIIGNTPASPSSISNSGGSEGNDGSNNNGGNNNGNNNGNSLSNSRPASAARSTNFLTVLISLML